MNIDKSRQFWIDNEKGVFLFLIVLGHLGNIPDSIRWLLVPTDLLYVPLFFFLSGWLFRKDNYSFKAFVLRKTQTLLIPYMAISIMVSLFDWNLYFHPFSYLENFLPRLFYGDGAAKASPLWFVSTLYAANILLKCLYMVKDRCLRNIVLYSLPFLCYFLYFRDIRLPLRIDSALGACFIMYLSQEVRLLLTNEAYKRVLLAVSTVLLVMGLYQKVGLLNYNTVHSIYSFPCAIGGCIVITCIFKKLLNKYITPPIWIAQNGLPILGLHCLLSFYVDAFSKIFIVSNTEFVFCFKIVFIFSALYFIIIPVLGRVKPKWWGITN